MNDTELRAHEFALEMTKIYSYFSLNTSLKTATESAIESATIKLDCDKAIEIYKAVFESAKKKLNE